MVTYQPKVRRTGKRSPAMRTSEGPQRSPQERISWLSSASRPIQGLGFNHLKRRPRKSTASTKSELSASWPLLPPPCQWWQRQNGPQQVKVMSGDGGEAPLPPNLSVTASLPNGGLKHTGKKLNAKPSLEFDSSHFGWDIRIAQL